MAKIQDVQRWRAEIELSEKFRDDEFGKRTENSKIKAGQNIDYFERGFSDYFTSQSNTSEEWLTTLNIIDSITSIIVPSLYFKNPRSVVVPQKVESEDTAPIVGKTIDYYRKALDIEEINKKVIWDAYVLGYGVYKVGYSTKFGMDIEDEEAAKRKKKSLTDKTLESIGLKKKEPIEEPERKEIDLRIVSENPFLEYVNPFDFLIDSRATSINNAMWVAHSFRKTVDSMKKNKKYKNTEHLQGMEPEDVTVNMSDLHMSSIEAFQTVYLWEIHYRNDGEWYLLVLSKDGSDEWREHYHEKSIYKLGGFQFDMLTLKKHGHALYPRSDITKIKNLQDRITSTVDSILEQVDKYVPKIAFESGSLTEQGMNALEFGGIGALVECNKNPDEAMKELNFTQLKADLQALIDQLISLISVQTGLTRAQLTGLSQSGSATEATIEQGGQTLRISDMTGSVRKFINDQSSKLWKVIRQFVELEDLQLINGIKGIDQETGLPKYDWLIGSGPLAAKMQEGEYDFDIEVGSTEKINMSVMRKAFENLFSILARSEVVGLIQQQGKKVDLGEILQKYFGLFPEMGIDSGKIIQNINQGTTGLIQPDVEQRGGTTAGSNFNQLEAQAAQPEPTIPNQIGAAQ